MLATVVGADSAKVQEKKYRGFIYSEAEPYAMYAIYKQTIHCVFYSIVNSIQMELKMSFYGWHVFGPIWDTEVI